jgi:hypothetical protein
VTAALTLNLAHDADERSVRGAQLREVLGLPTDRRGVVLACGSVALAAVAIILLAGGELTGIVYLLAAVANYLFLHRRLLPALVWAGVAGIGALALVAGNPVAAVQVLLAGLLTLVAAWPAARHGTPAEAITSPALPASRPAVDLAPAPADVPSPPAVAYELDSSPNGHLLPPAELPGRLTINTIGGLRLVAEGKDLTAGLERKPTLAFIWNYLLVREVAGMRPIGRPELAEEVSPTLPAKARVARLRKQLWDLQNDLPPVLSATVRDTGQVVSLSLVDARLDLVELKALAGRVRSSEALFMPEVRAEAEQFLSSLPTGLVLPRFEEYETAVSQGRGAAGSLIGAVRQDALKWRGDVADALAEHYLAAGEPGRAADLLAPLLDLDPSREDIARHLLVAYIKTSNAARAKELRRTYNLKQEA